jgi:hypothetical protein
MGDPRVHVRHLRHSDICMNGARAWFAAKGWSWGRFVAEGLPAQDFIDTGDPLAMRPVEAARREAENGR